MLWGPSHRLIEHEHFEQLAYTIGLTDYWIIVSGSEFCNVEGMSLSCSPPEPEDAPDSLIALLDTFSF